MIKTFYLLIFISVNIFAKDNYLVKDKRFKKYFSKNYLNIQKQNDVKEMALDRLKKISEISRNEIFLANKTARFNKIPWPREHELFLKQISLILKE